MVILSIKVIPNASKNEIVGWEKDLLRIRLNASPDKGKANDALIVLLSKTLKIPKRDIVILQGEFSRLKRVSLEGLDIQQIKDLFS